MSFRHWNSHQPLSTNLVPAPSELEMIPNERNSLKGFDGREDPQTSTESSSNSFSSRKEIIPSGVEELEEEEEEEVEVAGWSWLAVRVQSAGLTVLTVSTMSRLRWNIGQDHITSQTQLVVTSNYICIMYISIVKLNYSNCSNGYLNLASNNKDRIEDKKSLSSTSLPHYSPNNIYLILYW